jgi:hypothetical protein
MKACSGVNIYTHILLTSALDGGDWTASSPDHFQMNISHFCSTCYQNVEIRDTCRLVSILMMAIMTTAIGYKVSDATDRHEACSQ